MRILGIDYGEKHIGVAISDPLLVTAQGLAVIENKSDQFVLSEIKKMIDKYGIAKIVLGMPKTMRGEIGIQAEKVLSFAQKMEQAGFPPVETWDERLTTVAVERTLRTAKVSFMKRKRVVDKLAAVYMLQGYLDSLKK